MLKYFNGISNKSNHIFLKNQKFDLEKQVRDKHDC